MAILNQIRVNGQTYDVADGANIAEWFSTSKAYSKGDYCLHPDTGVLCRFKVDKAAGAWNAASVESVKMTNATNHDVGHVKAKVEDIELGIMIFDVNTETWTNSAITSGSGEISDQHTGRLVSGQVTKWPSFVKADDGYKVEIFAYDYDTPNDKYLGILQANGTFAKTVYWNGPGIEVDLRSIECDYIRFQFAVDVAGSSTPISVQENIYLKVSNYAIRDKFNRNSILENMHNVATDLVGYVMQTSASSAVTPVANANANTTDYIPVKSGETLIGHGFRRYWWFSEVGTTMSSPNNGNGHLSDAELIDLYSGARSIIVPEGAKYIRFSYVPRAETNPDVDTYLYRKPPFAPYYQIGGMKYYALGSSLVKGTFSKSPAGTVGVDATASFVWWVAQINNYDLTNLGIGGQGWRNLGNETQKSACDVVDDNYDPSASPAVNNFSDADIITLTFGTNDYKAQWKADDTAAQEWTLGSIADTPSKTGSVIAAMRYVIEKLAEAAPSAQIIVTLPGNFKKLGYDSNNQVVYALEENNYAMGTPNHENKTLADYRAAMKECADYYGIRTVDLAAICAGNRLNIDTMQMDGIHPTREYYKKIGYEIAPFIR